MSDDRFVPASEATAVSGGAAVPPEAGDATASQWAPVPAPKSRKGLFTALGVAAGVLVVGGGGYLAVGAVLGGGGAQPESVLPANAIAFAKVDLDPSGSQKIDALRFLRKLPEAPADLANDNADLRKVIFDEIVKDGGLEGLDYAKDIEPWLGQRFGMAIVPGADAGSDPVPLLAVAVTDVDAAKAGLAKVGKDSGYCTVLADYALCGEEQAAVDAAAASGARASLADAADFAADSDALGEKGIASYWVDATKANDLIKQAADAGGADLGGAATSIAGRSFGALRFDGANLELAGKAVNTGYELPAGKATSVGALPADTLAAVGFTGGADLVKQRWADLPADATASLSDFSTQTGIKLPDDLAALLGSSFTVAFGGLNEDQQPKVALITDTDKAQIEALANKVTALGTPFPLTVTGQDGRTVVSMTSDYASAIGSGSGLADSDAFKAAAPDAAGAQVVLFANVAGLVEQLGTDMTAEDRKVADIFSGVGFTATSKDGVIDYRLRAATK